MNPSSDEWRRLIEEIMKCRKCPLYKYRRNPVPGEGSLETDIMFVGEAPGAREDETGRPFVGSAGKLLTKLLEGIGIRRKDVFITNIVKCRPPRNRDPTDEEINACLPYLIRQIKLIKPRVIVALGRHAARVLFRISGLRWENMSRMHGRGYDAYIDNIHVKIYPTYHPAAALYYPKLLPVLEEDFNKLKDIITRVRRDKTSKKTILDYF